jgi:hypothetical protein
MIQQSCEPRTFFTTSAHSRRDHLSDERRLFGFADLFRQP